MSVREHGATRARDDRSATRNRRSPDDIPSRALRAYLRRFGSGAPQPSSASLELITDASGRVFVILSNVRGELATYRVHGGRLRFVEVGG